MKTLKKKLAVAITVALLAFPLSTTLTLAADTPIPTTTATATTTTELQVAEAAVAAYEAGPITTLAEVTTAEGLKASAVTAVTAVAAGDVDAKTALELRITNRTQAIATAKTTLQAKLAVVAYEAGPITTLAEVATAEGLKAAAVTAVAAVGDATAKTALELRITNRTQAITTAKATLAAQVVDANGNIVTSSNWFKDLIVKIQLALTFDPARKGELNERQALAKLAEAQELMKEGKPEAAQISLSEYTDKIAKAQAFLDLVKDPNSETAKTLATALANINSNNIQVLGNLLDKLPPQAAQKLALNVVRTMEKAVQKLQKEEAKDALVTTPTTPSAITVGTTPAVDNKNLEKQAKAALENFKKSLKQKGKIHIEDQDQQDNEDKNVVEQSKTQSQSPQTQAINLNQPNHVTVAPVIPQIAPTVTKASEHGKKDPSPRTENGKNKGGDNQDNQRND
jgi:uncharacterized protein YqgV (UPF0045/DUF77 family)